MQCHNIIKRLGISAVFKGKTKESETQPEAEHFVSKQFPIKNTLKKKKRERERQCNLNNPKPTKRASQVKNLPANAGDARDASSIPRSGKSPGVGNGTVLQYPCLEKSHRKRSLVGYSPRGLKESDKTEQACMHTHTHTHTSLLYSIQIGTVKDYICQKTDYMKRNVYQVSIVVPHDEFSESSDRGWDSLLQLPNEDISLLSCSSYPR